MNCAEMSVINLSIFPGFFFFFSAGLNGQESLEDCSIRFDDLEIGECIKTGRRCKIYK